MIALTEALVGKIKPILAGQLSYVQGAVLGDLLAIWLHGHKASQRQADMREQILQEHMQYVRTLVLFYEATGMLNDAQRPTH